MLIAEACGSTVLVITTVAHRARHLLRVQPFVWDAARGSIIAIVAVLRGQVSHRLALLKIAKLVSRRTLLHASLGKSLRLEV